MPLDVEHGAKALQLVTSRYDRREWRKKIEKTLSLPSSGLEDDAQRKIFMYLKWQLQAYKSRRADPPSWIIGGYATKEVIDRARLRPAEIAPNVTDADVSFLGVDPGADVDEVWWEAMLVMWFETPEHDHEVSGASDADLADRERADDAAHRGEGSVSEAPVRSSVSKSRTS